jgi:TusA-related sulfurtransferase
MRATATLDCLGLYCPVPIARTKEELDRLEPGQTLGVVADDQGVKSDMAAWCRRTGNELVSVEEDEGRITLLVRKGRATGAGRPGR